MVDKGREFYNKPMQEWLDNNILKYYDIMKESQ